MSWVGEATGPRDGESFGNGYPASRLPRDPLLNMGRLAFKKSRGDGKPGGVASNSCRC